MSKVFDKHYFNLLPEPEVCRTCGEQFGEHQYWCEEAENERRNDRMVDTMAIVLRPYIELEVEAI